MVWATYMIGPGVIGPDDYLLRMQWDESGKWIEAIKKIKSHLWKNDAEMQIEICDMRVGRHWGDVVDR